MLTALLLVTAVFAQEALYEAPPPLRKGGRGTSVTGDRLYALLGSSTENGDAAAVIKDLKLKKLDSGKYYSDLGAPGQGLCLGAGSGRISRIYLSSLDERNAQCPEGRFGGELPFGLTFGMSREEVNAILGPPHTDDNWGDFWRDDHGGYLQVGYSGRGLNVVEISDDGWVAPAVLNVFKRNPRSKKGRLPAPSVSYGVEPAVAEANDDSFGEEQAPQAPSPPPQAVTPAPRPYVASAPVAPAAPAPSPVLPSIDNPARTGARAKNEAAVVIGLESYPFLGSGVPYANRDAEAFTDFLVYTRGVPQQNIQTMKSGAREQMVAMLQRAAKEAGSGGTVWVFFAGHGAASPNTGERMLLGDDVRADLVAFASRGVSVTEVEGLVSAAGARPVLVLDTCYSGASRAGLSITGGTRFIVPDYAAAPTAGAAQWNAASPDEISGPLNGAQHGAFTYFAVGALRGWADGELTGVRDGKVTAGEAQAYVMRMLRKTGTNSQRPVYVGPDDLVLSQGTEVGPGL